MSGQKIMKYLKAVFNPMLFVSISLVYMLLGLLQIGHRYSSVLTPVWSMVSAVFIIVQLLIIREVKWRKLIPILLVGIMYGVSVFMQARIEVTESLKVLLATLLNFGSMYIAGALIVQQKDRLASLYRAITPSLVGLCLTSLIAIWMFLSNYAFRGAYQGENLHLGIFTAVYESGPKTFLLYGPYRDTNTIIIPICLSILMSGYYIWRYFTGVDGYFGKWWRSMFHMFNLAVQVLYFPSANSRAGELVFLLAILLFFVMVASTRKQIRVVALIAGILMAGGVYYGYNQVLNQYVLAYERMNHIQPLAEVAAEDDEPSRESSQEQAATATSESQESSQNESSTEEVTASKGKFFELNNMRTILWYEAWQVFMKSPIWGVGYYGVPTYIDAFGIQSTYLVNGKAIHNSYLDVMVYYGLVVVAAWALMFVDVAAHAWRSLVDKQWSAGDIIVVTGFFIMMANSFFISINFVGINSVFALTSLFIGYLFNLESEKSTVSTETRESQTVVSS